MALAIDIINRRRFSNKIFCQLQPKKTDVMLYYPFIKQQKTFYSFFIAIKMERFSFKVGVRTGGKWPNASPVNANED